MRPPPVEAGLAAPRASDVAGQTDADTPAEEGRAPWSGAALESVKPLSARRNLLERRRALSGGLQVETPALARIVSSPGGPRAGVGVGVASPVRKPVRLALDFGDVLRAGTECWRQGLQFQEAERRRFDDKYEVLDIIGHGSAGLVRRGYRRADRLGVAIKTVRTGDDEDEVTAAKEFAVLAEISHPHIVKALDFFRADCQAIMVLEHFCDQNLWQAVKTARSAGLGLPEEESRTLFRMLLGAVDYLHQHRILHRDVKPQNVLVAEDLRDLRLIDFNVVCSLDDGGGLTMTGTPQYSPPEVLQGSSHTYLSDVWAAGMCLYYSLQGELPFRFEDFMGLGHASMERFATYVAEHPVEASLHEARWNSFSEPCRETLSQCLAVDKAERSMASTILAGRWLSSPNRGASVDMPLLNFLTDPGELLATISEGYARVHALLADEGGPPVGGSAHPKALSRDLGVVA